ncbi:hypothetical protein ACFYVL_09410 [Streptomyces sp. NPDC004111]|uniref:hypothetical protein n=1 Tax=Streptomyces sp. NPDC004111 TaxID=3364690 RepID=UPI0036815FBE
MPDPTAIRLADDIAHKLVLLASLTDQLPAPQATQVIARVLSPNGAFSGFAHLVATSSRFARDQAERGALPAEAWLALGRAANELDTLSADLDEHHTTLAAVSTCPTTTPAGTPAAAPLVVRRRR